MNFSLEILSIPAPDLHRINEDAWLALELPTPARVVIAAVIDGAGVRLTLPPLEAYLKEEHHGLTAAAFAATTVRVSLLSQFTADPTRSLRAALLVANETLRQAVTAAIGDFSPAHILSLAGEPPNGDPRRARLALPACVVTLLRFNYTTQHLDFAHAGDTGLLEIRRDGDVITHTTDQMGPYDRATLQLAARLQQERDLPHFVDTVRLANVQRFNIENGIHHNYVDEQGCAHPGQGCGVIDGLPELDAYIETGSLAVTPQKTHGFLLHSDGLGLLAPLNETTTQRADRIRQTAALLQEGGLRRLFDAVYQMAETDTYFDQYPRIKRHDDATGIYLRF